MKKQGGDNIKILIDIFFITLIINFFISIYIIYTFFEIKIFKQIKKRRNRVN